MLSLQLMRTWNITRNYLTRTLQYCSKNTTAIEGQAYEIFYCGSWHGVGTSMHCFKQEYRWPHLNSQEVLFGLGAENTHGTSKVPQRLRLSRFGAPFLLRHIDYLCIEMYGWCSVTLQGIQWQIEFYNESYRFYNTHHVFFAQICFGAGHVLLTYLASLVVSLLFESPLFALEKLFLPLRFLRKEVPWFKSIIGCAQ